MNQPFVLCVALAWAAGFVSLSLGALEDARRYGEELVAHAWKFGLAPFHAAGLCVRGSVAARLGEAEAGIGPLREGLAGMRQAVYLLFYPFFLAELAVALGSAGRAGEALEEIDGAARFAEATGYRWFMPEILRSKGELLLGRGSDDSDLAEALFRQSVAGAGAQQALYWELSSALSLAELIGGQGRGAEASAILRPVYRRFTEGFDVARMRRAKAFLDRAAA